MIDWLEDIKSQFWKDGRLEDVKQLAKELDYKFIRREQFSDQPYGIKGFRIFKGKKPKRLKGILWNKDFQKGIRLRIYDYVYYNDDRIKTTTVFELEKPDFQFSKFLIRPKRGSGYFFRQLFADNSPKAFDYHPAFERTHFAQTQDIYELEAQLNDAFIDLLIQQENLRVEGERNYLVFYRKHQKLNPPEIKKDLQHIMEMVDALMYKEDDEYV